MGIAGLDVILGGGIPKDRLYLVEGDPGVGKTTLALQFLLAGVKRGERALYITMSETEAEIRAIGESHGWRWGFARSGCVRAGCVSEPVPVSPGARTRNLNGTRQNSRPTACWR